jgi:N-acetylmuramoyl-L-alanine amidase
MVEHRIERLTIHHTGVELGDNRLAPSRLRAHQVFHQEDRGWPDLAYHFAIDRGGNVYEGRSFQYRGDTATSYDPTGHLLAVLEGNFDVEPTAKPQMEALAQLLAWGAGHFSVGADAIKSHRDYANGETSCPGANLYELLESGAIGEMVQSTLDGGVPRLVYLRGTEAIARVTAIESSGS